MRVVFPSLTTALSRPAGARVRSTDARGEVDPHGRRWIVSAVAVVGLGVLAAPADAGWTPATTRAPAPGGLDTTDALAFVTGGAPGQVALLGSDAGGNVVGVPHVGPAWTSGSGALATAGLEDEPIVGSGGAVMWKDSGAKTHLGLVAPDGTATDLGSVSGNSDWSLEGVAARNGNVTGVLVDANLRLVLLRAGAGRPTTLERPLGTDATISAAAVAPRTDGAFDLAWSDADAAGITTAIRTSSAGPTGGMSWPQALADLTLPLGRNAAVDAIELAPDADRPTVAWSEQHLDRAGDPDKSAVWAARSGKEPQKLDARDEGLSTAGDFEVRVTGDGVVGTWLWTDDDDNLARRLFSLAPDGTLRCTADSPLPYAALTTRGGSAVLAAADDAGVLSTRVVGASCAESDVSSGPTVGSPSAISAEADAEGTVVVAATDANGTVIAADDRTAPQITRFTAPSIVAAADPLLVSAEAVDAWGVPAFEWRIDGQFPQAGSNARFDGLSAGRHAASLVVSDGSANVRSASQDVTVGAADPTTPAPPPKSDPVPVAPPVDVPIPPADQAPVASPSDRPVVSGKPRRPAVRVRSVRHTSAGWTVRVSVRGARVLRFSLFREKYQPGAKLRRPARCPAPRPAGPRPRTGLQGRITVQSGGSSATVRLPRAMVRALARRGRYTLRVTAFSGARATGSTSVSKRRFTVC